MVKNIVIEGPDCSGKSTLVNSIKNKLKWDSKSLHHRNGNQFERYLKEYVFNSKTVFDRAHFSECVYSQLWRRGIPFSKKELEALNFILQKDSLIIFILPDLKDMKQRYLSRDYKQQIKIDELEKSRFLFEKIMSNINCITYHARTFYELNELISKIKAMVKK